MKIVRFILFVFFILNVSFATSRDCPENFTLNPQYPAISPECFPDEFVHYSSTNLAFYLFESVLLNNQEISAEDWLGSFTCNEWQNNECIDYGNCIGTRLWEDCGESLACDVPVLGDDNSSFTEGYILTGQIPAFKIYDTSSNMYINAIASENIPWEYLNSPFVDSLNSFEDISGCTNPSASNYDQNSNIDDGSCILQDIECDFDINDIEINPANYQYNGSVTAAVYIDNSLIGSEEDYLIGYHNDEPRGMINGLYFPVTGNYTFNLMLFSNQAAGEEISFRFYYAESQQTYCLDETLNFESDMIIGNAFDPFIININVTGDVYGCTDITAENYNPDATIDDDSCIFENDLPPDLFQFNQSSYQAFYFINNVTIDGANISSDDWVGSFNNDICVGAKKWDTSLCSSGVCEVAIMGDDGEEYSEGYMTQGGFPSFKIYDFSDDTYYDAIPSTQESWSNNSAIIIELLSVSTDVFGCTDSDACNYNLGANVDDGSCIYPDLNFDCAGNCITEIDCNGTCNGIFSIDECGQCIENGECVDIDTDNICDCIDDCIGLFDECEVCNGPGLNESGCCNNEIQDCNGICGGNALLDQCGICDNNFYNDCTQDCLGDWGGNAEYDDCGVCDGNNNDLDCSGVCFGNSVIDECNICGGDNSSCNTPIAYNQNLEVNEDTSLNFSFNSTDPNGDLLQVIIISNPIHGVLELGENLNATYTPDSNYNGTDNIVYKTTDGIWESNDAQIIITINASYDPPITSDISIELLEDDSILIDLGAYDTDSDDSSIIFSIINEPDFGILIEQRATATYLYTPNLNYNGTDEFIYEASDGENASQSTVYINVLNTNDTPTALNFDFTELTTIDFSEFINDIDGDVLSLNTIPPSQESNLTTIFGNELVYSGIEYIYNYIPSGDFDILLYKASDQLSESNVATAIYDNNGDAFNRDNPTALSDDINMQEDTQIQISFFGFDYDGFFNGFPTIEITTLPSIGILGELSEPVISGFIVEWTTTYTPNENYFGDDLISFSVTDDNGDISDEDGIISISISPVNDAPVLNDVSDIELNEDEVSSFMLTGIDIENTALFISVSGGTNIIISPENNEENWQSFSISSIQNWFGSEIFTATVSDGELSNSEIFTITVNPVNDAPILLTDLSNIVFDEDSSLFIELYANDIDGDELTFTSSIPNTIIESFEGNTLSLSAPENWFGSENWQIYTDDGQAQDINEIFVTVNPINDAPVINSTSPSEIEISIGYEYNIEVLDVDGDNIILSLIGAPEDMSINNQIITWTNIPDDVSYVEFVLSASDGALFSYENISLSIVQFYDCNGIANGNSTEDCLGVCDGNAIEDQCGICDGDNSSCSGCTNEEACNYDPDATISNNSDCQFPEYLYNCDNECLEDDDNDGICNLLEVEGCTDEVACNYDEQATDDDGSCIYPEENYDCDGNCIADLDCLGVCGGNAVYDECDICDGDGSSCAECESDIATWTINPPDYQYNGSVTSAVIINGVQVGSELDMLAGFVNDEVRGVANGLYFPITQAYTFNIMLFSNQVDDETISFKYYHAESGEVFCLDETVDFESDMIIGNAIVPFEFNIDVEFILGCNDESACNYDAQANFNDGSCVYPEGYYDCDGICLNDTDQDGVCDEEDICSGYSNIDSDGDGICDDSDNCIGFDNENDIDNDGVCDDFDPCFGFDNQDIDNDGICNDAEILGCQDDTACNYDSSATDEGECTYAEEFYDCDGNCIADTDSDSVCDELEILGCQDDTACNYDSSATDEGECTYVEEFYDCDGNCIAEIDCDGVCGGDSFIDDCGYCVEGGTNPDDCLSADSSIPKEIYLNQNYPNPFNPSTTIEYAVPVGISNLNLSLYDMHGRLVKTFLDGPHQAGYFSFTLTSNNLNSGIYIIKLLTENNIITKKITVIK